MAIYKNSPPIVTDGLVLYLDATNPQSYNSGSTIWSDVSGNNNNATVIPSSFLINQFLTTPTARTHPSMSLLSFTTSSNWSFNLTFKAEQTGSSLDYFRLCCSGIDGDSSWLRLEWNNRVLASAGTGLFFSGFTPACSLTKNINDLTMTCTQGTASLFLNGIKTTYFALQRGTLFIDKIGTGQNGVTSGSIFSFKAYNRALSQQEITQNYNAMKGRFNL